MSNVSIFCLVIICPVSKLMFVIHLPWDHQFDLLPDTGDHSGPSHVNPPSCNKTPLNVNYLRFTVNAVKEKDGSTVHNLFCIHFAIYKVMICILQFKWKH